MPVRLRADNASLAWKVGAPAIVLGVFLAPYISWRPSVILFTTSDALFVLGVVLIIAAHRMPLRPFGQLTPYWLLGVTAMLGGLFVGSIVNGSPDRWLIAGAQYLFSFVLLPIVLMGHGPQRTFVLAKALLAGVVCMELFGSAAYFAYGGSYEELQRFGYEFVTGAGRLSAFLADANWNAAVIAMALPFAYYLRVKRRISAATFAVAVTILLVGLMLTASVTGTSSSLLATLLFVLVARIRPSFRLIFSGVLAVAFLFSAGYTLPKAFENRIAPALEAGDLTQAGTFVGRSELIQEAWSMVDDHIVIGLGVDQYREVSEDKAPVHNLYLLLWAEGGLISLIGWLSMISILAARAVRTIRQDRAAAALGLSVLLTFIIFSNAAPHMYARVWMVPLLLAMAPCFFIGGERPIFTKYRGWPIRDALKLDMRYR